MYIGTYVRILLITLLVAGCSTQGGARQGAFDKPPDTLMGLMDYNTQVSKLDDEAYRREMNAARSDYGSGGSASARMRLAILLMNGGEDQDMNRFRESESLLRDYLDDRGFAFFERDYVAFARMLLSINLEWQRLQNQLTNARVQTADARKKLEELKSIELHMNHPGNGYE